MTRSALPSVAVAAEYFADQRRRAPAQSSGVGAAANFPVASAHSTLCSGADNPPSTPRHTTALWGAFRSPLIQSARSRRSSKEDAMAADQNGSNGPDLAQGIALVELADGAKLVGHVGEELVLLARRGAEVFAIGAHCSHYHAPLIDGLIVDDTIRCPWHHACFDLRTGEALRAPAFGPLAAWSVEQRDGKIFVQGRKGPEAKPRRSQVSEEPKRIVVVGGGAAGFAAVEMLRREKYQGEIVMLSNDDAPPVDRPNLSKDYLAGNAPEEWVPLQPDSFYSDNQIDLRLKANVARIEPRSREVALTNGETIAFDRLLIATGAEPIRLAIPGADQPRACVLRSLSDCR